MTAPGPACNLPPDEQTSGFSLQAHRRVAGDWTWLVQSPARLIYSSAVTALTSV